MLWTSSQQVASVLQAMAEAKSAESKRIGQLIACLRERKAWSQEDLAREIEVSTSTISRWERGLHKGYAPNVRKLAAALDVEPAILLPAEDLPIGSQLDRIEAMIDELYYRATGAHFVASTPEVVGQLPDRLAETDGSTSTKALDRSETQQEASRRKNA